MLAVFFVTGFMVVANGPAPTRDVDVRSRELVQVIEQARRDFEARHAELGLVGAAPLAGRERAQLDPIPERRAESLGMAKAPPSSAAPAPGRGSR